MVCELCDHHCLSHWNPLRLKYSLSSSSEICWSLVLVQRQQDCPGIPWDLKPWGNLGFRVCGSCFVFCFKYNWMLSFKNANVNMVLSFFWLNWNVLKYCHKCLSSVEQLPNVCFSFLEVKQYYDRNYQAFFLFVFFLNFNSKQVKLQ